MAVSSSQALLVHELTVIFPLVCHPRKFWSTQILDKFQRKLKCKVAQGDSAGRFTQRKNVGVTNLRPQATSPAMKKHQSTGSAQKAGKEESEMNRLGMPDMEANTVVPSPVQKTIFSGISQGEKCAVCKIPAAGSRCT